MRAIGIFSHFVMLIFLTVFLWIGIAYVSQNIRYSSARQFHNAVIYQLENSNFANSVINECKEKARRHGYRLTVETYGSGDHMDGRVILDLDYVFPVIQTVRHYTIEGYAR